MTRDEASAYAIEAAHRTAGTIVNALRAAEMIGRPINDLQLVEMIKVAIHEHDGTTDAMLNVGQGHELLQQLRDEHREP